MGGVTRRLVIDCGAAETRAAFLVDDEPRHFWFGPARGDEALPRPPQSGDIFAGRVRSVAKPLNGAFVDIGAARDGFLPFKKNDRPPVEGAAIIVRIRRPQIDAKGAVLTLGWTENLSAEAAAILVAQAASIKIGALGEPADAAIQAFVDCGMPATSGDRAIITNDPAAKRLIEENASMPVAIEDAPFKKFQLDQAIAEALEPCVTHDGGAALNFHETPAGALIDVDSARAAGGATGRLNDKINLAAAARVFPEISRRAIAGRVIVDFLPPSGAAARAKLAETVKENLKSVAGARFGKLAADGLCDFTIPRQRLSLLMGVTEPAGNGWPVEGRRFTLDHAAKSAIGVLECALATRPSATPRLIVARDIADYLLAKRPQWAERLNRKFGDRIRIEPDATREPRTYDLVE
jgi:Ribonuclease G/E